MGFLKVSKVHAGVSVILASSSCHILWVVCSTRSNNNAVRLKTSSSNPNPSSGRRDCSQWLSRVATAFIATAASGRDCKRLVVTTATQHKTSEALNSLRAIEGHIIQPILRCNQQSTCHGGAIRIAIVAEHKLLSSCSEIWTPLHFLGFGFKVSVYSLALV